MAMRSARALVLGMLALSNAASASSNQNYTSSYSGVEALRAQLALMDDRPGNCPPWFVPSDMPPLLSSALASPPPMLPSLVVLWPLTLLMY